MLLLTTFVGLILPGAVVNMSALQKAISNNADTIVFSGSSPEDSAYAKTFWQSVQLLPPMESRLVSSHISQRLKTAPAFGAPGISAALCHTT